MTNEELLAIIEKTAEEDCEELGLSGQGLSELSPEIGALTKLKSLILGKWDKENSQWLGNHLTRLPPEIGQLQSLKKFNLFFNNLTSLP